MAEQRAGIMNIYQKLAKIRAMSEVAQKNKQGFNYSYVDEATILATVTAGMKKYGVSLIPSITPGTSSIVQNITTNTKFDKTGKQYQNTTTEMLYSGEIVFIWVNDDNPEEKIMVPWFMTGSMSDPAQAMGSAVSYCNRRFLTAYFQIAQVDSDIDSYRSKQKAAETSEDKAIAEGIIEKFDVILKQFLADNPTKTDKVKKFISKFAKNANYLAIKEPQLAAKLLEDFQNTYIKNENKE